jgi:putative tryptophan/tyrosine transport system substrate-binding protein
MNDRRKLMVALGVGMLLPRWATAQQGRVYRIGWLANDRADNSPFFDAFRDGLRDLGYIEGRNLVIEARWGEGSAERLDQLAIELVRSKPEIIVTQGGPATHPVMRAGATMPVVFGYSGDPVEAKVVNSFARPGHNFTGVSFLSLELVGKRMEFLKKALPGLKRVAIIARPEHPGEQGELRASQAAAKSLGLVIDYYPVRKETDLEDAFAALMKSRSEAIVAFPDALMMRYSEKIAAFAVNNRIPSISGWAQFAERGNLMSYGPNLRDIFRRLATYVDRIIKGAKPADLPVELPTTVELVVNMKAAKALGIKIPQSILVQATKVIE